MSTINRRFGAIQGHGLPVRGVAITLIGNTIVGKTTLEEWSARRRYRYGKTQHSQETNIYAHGGIRTHNPRYNF